MKINQSHVLIKDIRLQGFHGVLPQERVVGACFTINVSIGTDFSSAMANDELKGTISYADVYEVVKAEMAIPSQLLEHVAGRICKALFERFPTAETIHLEIIKENPPMGADCGGAGVSVDVKR